jgi:hypothetical protein
MRLDLSAAEAGETDGYRDQFSGGAAEQPGINADSSTTRVGNSDHSSGDPDRAAWQ